jgi:hypothetical protein
MGHFPDLPGRASTGSPPSTVLKGYLFLLWLFHQRPVNNKPFNDRDNAAFTDVYTLVCGPGFPGKPGR